MDFTEKFGVGSIVARWRMQTIKDFAYAKSYLVNYGHYDDSDMTVILDANRDVYDIVLALTCTSEYLDIIAHFDLMGLNFSVIIL